MSSLKGTGLMKRAYFVAVFAFLTACGQQPSSQALSPAASEVVQTNVPAQNIFCPESMGIQVDKVLLNMESGLKEIQQYRTPISESAKNITSNECGYSMTFSTHFGVVNINMNQQQELLTLGVGQVNTNDIKENMRNSFATMQAITSPFGRSRFGSTELGMKIMEVATAVQLQANANGGQAEQEFKYGGNTFMVGIKNKNLVLIVRKTVE